MAPEDRDFNGRLPLRGSPSRLPSGWHGLTREQVEGAQRSRVLRATIEVVADRGYSDARVVHIFSRAGVSSNTFYRDYSDKLDCFLAAFDAAFDDLVSTATRAFDGSETWIGGIRAVIGTVLETLAHDPATARVCFLEVLAAGPEAVERRRAGIDRLLSHICPDHDAGVAEDGPRFTAYTTVGGFSYIVQREIAANATSQLPLLAGELTYLATLPYVGPKRAAEQLAPS